MKRRIILTATALVLAMSWPAASGKAADPCAQAAAGGRESHCDGLPVAALRIRDGIT